MIVRRHPQERRRSAFTLMEMLIVVAIIVMLAGLGGYYIMGQYQESRVSTAKYKAMQISQAVKNFYIDHDRYPENIAQLLQKSELGKGPYLTKQDDILDPWGAQYQYDPQGTKNSEVAAQGVIIPDVFTTTPDGRMVGNWSDNKR
jgi:general secretion pathway protein G